MKRFLYHLFEFFVLTGFLLSLLVFCKSYICRNYDYSIPKEKSVLFMGASTLETAIDDSLLNDGLNVCQSSEHLMYTYLKMRYLIRDNPQIDTIFLGVSPVTWDRNSDDWIFNSGLNTRFMNNYSPLFSFDDYKTLLHGDPIDILGKIIPPALQYYSFHNRKDPISNFGGFLKLYTKIGEHPDAIYWGNEGVGDTYELNYMKKIIKLCDLKGVKLYFIYAPMIKAKIQNYEKRFYEIYNKYFSMIPLIDYSNMEINDSLRKDSYHLNYWGAQIFTKKIKTDFNLN